MCMRLVPGIALKDFLELRRIDLLLRLSALGDGKGSS